MIKALRGMKDLTFEESRKFIYIIDKAVNIAKNYGYEYIETPILEETKLFKRSVERVVIWWKGDVSVYR